MESLKINQWPITVNQFTGSQSTKTNQAHHSVAMKITANHTTPKNRGDNKMNLMFLQS